MTYLTRIPDTTHAERRRAFFVTRAEARRSLFDFEAMQGSLVRASDRLVARNYLDVVGIERLGRRIVKISKIMRELRPVAEQPDPPRYENVSPEMTQKEARTYGGIKASRLVRVLRFVRGLRRAKGDVAAARRVLKMSDRLINGLDIYKRVKVLVAKLAAAVDAPETAMTPRPNVKRSGPAPVERIAFRWNVSPQEIYGWKHTYLAKGYDARQTSVYWLEKQGAALRRAVYRDYHSLVPGRSEPTGKTGYEPTEVRIYTPPQGAQLTDQIWPPIDLVRMIEARRASDTSAVNSALHPGPELGTQDKQNTNLPAEPKSHNVMFDGEFHIQKQDIPKNETSRIPLFKPD